MELLLNAAWALSFGVLIACCLYRSPSRRSLVFVLQRALAIACISALLFPVISITDDLAAQHLSSFDSSVSAKLQDRLRGKRIPALEEVEYAIPPLPIGYIDIAAVRTAPPVANSDAPHDARWRNQLERSPPLFSL